MDIDSNILILGKNSQTAKDIFCLLLEKGYANVHIVGRDEAELTDREEVERLFSLYRPWAVYCVAARTVAPKEHETYPWDVMRDNLLIQCNVFDACHKFDCKKLIWLSSDSALPYYSDFREVTEDKLFSSPVKGGVESYALAKLAGIQMCNAIEAGHGLCAVAVLPCNIYGAGQKGLMYNLCKDFMDAKEAERSEVRIWGGAA